MSVVKSRYSACVKFCWEPPNVYTSPGRNYKNLLQRIAQYLIVLSSGLHRQRLVELQMTMKDYMTSQKHARRRYDGVRS